MWECKGNGASGARDYCNCPSNDSHGLGRCNSGDRYTGGHCKNDGTSERAGVRSIA
jgi:hypothetical protein